MFLTALDDGRLVTLAIDRKTGRLLWRRDAPRLRQEKLHRLNHPASPSPVADGTNVYVFFPDYGLLAYTNDGRERWRVPLGPFHNLYGMGASPILAGDLLILVCDQSRDSFIAAFDTRTGRERWRSPRPHAVSGHSTPVLHRGTTILAPGSFVMDALDAGSGRTLWSYDGLPGEMKSVPVVDGDSIFVHGFNTPENDPGRMIAVPVFPGRFAREQAPTEHSRRNFPYLDLDSDGFLDAAEWASYQRTMRAENAMIAILAGGHVEWKFHRSIPQLPSPLLDQGVLYMINEGGILTTLDPATGTAHKQSRVSRGPDQYYASPVAADGKVFLTSSSGVISVLRAGQQQDMLAVNALEEECIATPAIAREGIFVRTRSAVYLFGQGSRLATR